MPSAGAMAAPAITVSSDIERMVAVTLLETLVLFICQAEFLRRKVLTQFYQAASKSKRLQRYEKRGKLQNSSYLFDFL